MSIEIKQGIGESLKITMPFDPSILGYYTVDLFQQGDAVISKDNTVCTVEGRTITANLTDEETALLSPQRVSLNFRGVYADGGQVIIEDIPCTVRRSQYRGTVDCGSSCVGQCTTGCFDSCTGACSGTCTGACSDACTGVCMTSCEGLCSGGCGWSCGAACGGSCTGVCSWSCGTGCSVASSGPIPPVPSYAPGAGSSVPRSGAGSQSSGGAST